jgi:hypothetical protein
MSSFERDADRVLAFIGEGLSIADACERARVPYGTVRKWITNGHRNPGGKYGRFTDRMASARIVEKPKQHPDDEPEPGPVESEVAKLLAGRDLRGEMPLVAAEARTLARSADRLSETRGGAAATALAVTSRRLEELIARLAVPAEDNIDRLREQRRARRATAAAALNGSGG